MIPNVHGRSDPKVRRPSTVAVIRKRRSVGWRDVPNTRAWARITYARSSCWLRSV